MSKSGSRAKPAADSTAGSPPRKSRKAAADVLANSAADTDSNATSFAPVTLPADLRIGSAAALHAEILASSARGEVVLDAGLVAKMDAAGVQAVLAALIQISHAGASWRWHNPSATFTQGVTVLGLGNTLRLP